jgi:hypothetical protein
MNVAKCLPGDRGAASSAYEATNLARNLCLPENRIFHFRGTVLVVFLPGLIEASGFWINLYHYAWFLSFGISFLVYAGLTLPRQDSIR